MQNRSSFSINCTGSCQKLFWEKSVPKNFAKFTGKELSRSLFFDKVVGSACNFIKKDTVPPVNFEKHLRTPASIFITVLKFSSLPSKYFFVQSW